ncbi:UU173 family protein [Mycoplasmopsis cricetuli]|uniref:UU173 family protein n=2 Tax=Mycoplasmopsis cricetuli TaxID=171283 RepID=UPI000470F712|nr:DUF2779 domain-containing protein [Mycoplasmopsis cricetuli]
MEKEIKWNLFKRVFWNNPALFWVGEDIIKNIHEKEYFKKWNLDSNIQNILNNLHDEDEDNLNEIPDFDFGINTNDLNNLKVKNIDQIELISFQNFLKLKDYALDFYANKYSIKKEEIKIIPLNKNNKQKNAETLIHLNDSKVKLIVNPIFLHQETKNNLTLNFIADGFLFDKNSNKLVLIAQSAKSSLNLFFKFYYLINIVKKQYKINDASVIIIDPITNFLDLTYKKKVNFFEASSANVTKNFSVSKGKKDTIKSRFYKEILKRTGDGILFFDTGHYNKNLFSFFNVAKYRYLKFPKIVIKNFENLPDDLINYNNYKNNDQLFFSFNNSNNIIEYYFQEFSWYIEYIFKAWKSFQNCFNYNAISYYFDSAISETTEDKINNFLTLEINYPDKNITQIDFPLFLFDDTELKITLRNYLFGPESSDASGYFFKFLKLSDNNLKNDINKKRDLKIIHDKVNNLITNSVNFFNWEIINIIKNLHLKNKRIIWYDYEGFSDLFPILDNAKSYQQIPFQVSIIETINGKITNKINYVLDTNNFSAKNLIQLIEIIYSNKSDYFVVYNKSYENARNTEIAKLITYYLDSKKDIKFNNWFFQKYNSIQEFTTMILHINNNTIDLYDCFKSRNWDAYSNEKFAFEIINGKINITNASTTFADNFSSKPLIYLKDLKFFSSIKKVEKFITKHQLKLKALITPYSELIIQQGTMAMKEAILRYHGLTGDNSWVIIEENLKKYCENDVMAMIMVYELIMELLIAKFPEINNYLYQFEQEFSSYKLINDKIEIQK